MKKIRLKKKHKLKVLFIPIFIFLLYQVIYYFALDIKLANGNEDFVKQLLQDSNYHLLYEKQSKNLFSKFLKFVNNIELKQPVTILENTFAYTKPNEEGYQVFSYMNNQNIVVDKPRVYIYSTHPTEEYAGEGLKEYDIDPGVMMASYILQEKLNSIGIQTLVEERSAATYIKENNLTYEQSYTATREFVNTTVKKYPDLELIIDLHRDGTTKAISTTTINDKNYARVMFVMNKIYPNFNKAKTMSDMLNKAYTNLSRGIYDKHTGRFNQDINTNVMLLELGGEHNTINEVVNTIDVLTNIIKEYLDER